MPNPNRDLMIRGITGPDCIYVQLGKADSGYSTDDHGNILKHCRNWTLYFNENG